MEIKNLSLAMDLKAVNWEDDTVISKWREPEYALYLAMLSLKCLNWMTLLFI